MSPPAARTFRLMLRAYPAEVRRSYGDAMLQTVADRYDHEGVSWTRIVARVLFDATQVAPLTPADGPCSPSPCSPELR